MSTVLKISIALVLSVLSFGLEAQSPFEKDMQKAFELWTANKTDEAVNLFERIAKAKKTIGYLTITLHKLIA